MKSLIIGAAITGLIVYGLFQFVIYLLTKNEQNYQKNAHKVTWTHEDMLAMAKKLSIVFAQLSSIISINL